MPNGSLEDLAYAAQVTNSSDRSGSDTEAPVDAGIGQVVASWDSVQSTNGGDYPVQHVSDKIITLFHLAATGGSDRSICWPTSFQTATRCCRPASTTPECCPSCRRRWRWRSMRSRGSRTRRRW